MKANGTVPRWFISCAKHSQRGLTEKSLLLSLLLDHELNVMP